MAGYNTITLGALTLTVDRITPEKLPGTVKQVIGKDLIQKEIPGRTVQDWKLVINGRLIGSTRHTDRDTLTGYDDLIVHTLVDGIHDGNYFIESLIFDDAQNLSTRYNYTLVLIQDQ